LNERRDSSQAPLPKRRSVWWWLLVPVALAGAAYVYFRERPRGPETAEAPDTVAAPPPAVPPAQVNPWREAAKKVEENRGEPMGRAARVHVPAELRHYADKRRFLAIQVAAWMEKDYPLPHDEAELAQMIERGEMVEVASLGDDHILYGVGANATGDPFGHYDRKTDTEIPLYPRYDLFQDAAAEWSAKIDEKKAAAATATAEAAKLPRAQARRRRALLAEARQARQEAAAIEKRKGRTAAWYDDPARRRLLVSEWQAIDDIARRLRSKPYDLDDPKDRRALRGRVLSYLRPSARDTLMALAAQYHARFGRPLAVTSLVRTQAYQRLLGESNANATRISVPPHTTGLAFDVYYRYMSGSEQDAFMGMVADLEHAGRVEALRENRDHIHMMALPEGRRPPETLIAEAMGVVRPGARLAARKAKTPAGTARAAKRPARSKVSSSRTAGAAASKAAVRRTAQRPRPK
jgi:uncharacterized protein DUF5715